MFVSRRHLKKDRSKIRFKLIIVAISIVLVIVSLIIFIYILFSQNNSFYISPLAKESATKIFILENSLDDAQIEYKSVNTNQDGSLRVSLKQGSEVIMSPKKDIKTQVTSLQLILSRLTIEGKKLKVLDFRFNDPVISF